MKTEKRKLELENVFANAGWCTEACIWCFVSPLIVTLSGIVVITAYPE